MKPVVPAFQVEEHHEAFLVWHYAIQHHFIPRTGNTMLHIDEHADLETPRLRRPLEHLGAELQDVAEFTYAELDIGNFIWPAAYLGIFDEYYWIRHGHDSQPATRRLFIRPTNKTKTEFVISANDGSGSKELRCSWISADSVFTPRAEVMLDIDLDYFSSNRYPDLSGRRIEITEETWKEFTTNRYHFLRLSPGSRIEAAHENGRYFLYFNQFGPTDITEHMQARQIWDIVARVDGLMAFLDRNEVHPKLILTCRSRHSGYTPADQCSVIENAIWDRLKQRYHCIAVPIEQVLTEVASSPARSENIR